MSCKKHKRYKAKRKPTAQCLGCWDFYVREHEADDFTSEDMWNVMNAGDAEVAETKTVVMDILDDARNKVERAMK